MITLAEKLLVNFSSCLVRKKNEAKLVEDNFSSTINNYSLLRRKERRG